MQDYSYFEAVESPPIDTEDEALQLQDLAKFVGSHIWSYKPEAQDQYNVDNDTHIGIIAQDLLKVPGLAGAVHTDEYGNLKVNTDYVALAALAYCAALARTIINGTSNANADNGSNDNISETVSAEADATPATAADAQADNLSEPMERPETI